MALDSIIAEQVRRQTAERIRARREHNPQSGEPEPAEVHYEARKAYRGKAAELGRRKVDGVVLESVVPAHTAIETPTHAYSGAALRRERNRRKALRRAR